MDLTKFKQSTRKTNYTKAGFFKKNYTRIKYWLYPPTTDQRKLRLNQYKDISLCLTAIILVCIFQQRIKQMLEIDTDLVKMDMM